MVCTFWIVLMCWCQKWFLKNEKNIIVMHFGTKIYLKSTRNHTAKHALRVLKWLFRIVFLKVFICFFYIELIFLYFLSFWYVNIKNNFLKNKKKYYFNIFLNKKHFKIKLLLYSPTSFRFITRCFIRKNGKWFNESEKINCLVEFLKKYPFLKKKKKKNLGACCKTFITDQTENSELIVSNSVQLVGKLDSAFIVLSLENY